MKSQIILKNKGFSLFEIIIVMFIVSSLILMGSFIDQRIQNRTVLSEEESILISVLQKARNRAMNNINKSEHGIHIIENSYIIFRVFPFHLNETTNEILPKNGNIKITASSNLLDSNNQIEIIFEQLSGNPKQIGEIELSDGINKKNIHINRFGFIDW